ncbi:peptide deformylase [Pseudofrankia sp. BMG5.37]|uniref:peptide deformylase n=1 Tax=Pseudofrankia sp. BMG5.37 TaxID=3050035 RepID=UPI0028952843|nr:peptide deformylase [Pseudofrankia sp. BMG5.37]MDT3443444.1 peptide deformylase [Pseudofrankia sp. BMG5.37]
MTILPIRVLGDPILRTPADPVTVFDDRLRRLVDDMIETMYAAPGVGLAAPQVGVGLRLFVFDTDWQPNRPDRHEDDADADDQPRRRQPRVVANPVLELGPGEQTDQEGCLSVPGYHYATTRAASAIVRGVDAHGEPVEHSGTGLLARCLQHESDHLAGTLYLDRLTGLTRRSAARALRDPTLPAPGQPGAQARAGSGQSGDDGDGFLAALRRRR